jgi:hypothetical protein
MKLKFALKVLPLIAASAAMLAPVAADALTLDFSNIANEKVTFSGGSFQFGDGTANTPSFSITSTDGVATSVGLLGSISGNFAIDPISTGDISSGVSGSGVISLFETGVGPITTTVPKVTADISFDDIYTLGAIGGVQVFGTGNITNFDCDGCTIADYTALAQAGIGTGRITFQFGSATSLQALIDAGTAGHSPITSSFSGTLTAVPIPAAAWLFGSALIGIVTVGRRKRA